MKLNKKKVVVLALAVCLIATLSLGSLAWFTHSDSVTNEFFVAGSENQNPDGVFSVNVWETDKDGVRHEDGIEYPAILPGDNLVKNVNIENTGAYEQYIRVTVTVSDARFWQDIYGVVFVPLNEIATDLNPAYEGYRVEYNMAADTLTYVLHYNSILVADEISNLFTNVHIPEEMTREQAHAMGEFSIKIVADAVQTANVGNSAAEAFNTVNMGVEPGAYVTNITTENVAAILEFMAKNENAQAELNLAGVAASGNAAGNKGDLIINDGELNFTYIHNYNHLVLNGTVLNVANPSNYGLFSNANSVTELTDVEINLAGGGIVARDGAQVVFHSGKMELESTATAHRHMFYVYGEGTKVVIEDGEFSFDSYRKRTYVYVADGAVVEIYGGTFGVAPNHPTDANNPIMEDGGEVIIYGGTFGFDPTDWVAEGYQAVKSGNVWIVSAI